MNILKSSKKYWTELAARKRSPMSSTPIGTETMPAAPKIALPEITCSESLTLHFGDQELKIIHFPQGHTPGDEQARQQPLLNCRPENTCSQ